MTELIDEHSTVLADEKIVNLGLRFEPNNNTTTTYPRCLIHSIPLIQIFQYNAGIYYYCPRCGE